MNTIWWNITIGTAIIGMSIFIGIYFKNPHPCSSSCIGCSSMIEYFKDSWSIFFSAVGLVFGIGYIYYIYYNIFVD